MRAEGGFLLLVVLLAVTLCAWHVQAASPTNVNMAAGMNVENVPIVKSPAGGQGSPPINKYSLFADAIITDVIKSAAITSKKHHQRVIDEAIELSAEALLVEELYDLYKRKYANLWR